ncbi:phage portal protein [Curtobacterium sp. UCD-KPL2560]|uniref:phage portal protein n=1 Tax=Curtobacterium sp. UCD-KPL2560 TaxID=1885315 RepID=UPI00082593C0|nr:phage portal protein [Curtobacterium sp. UCD-KPL2560]
MPLPISDPKAAWPPARLSNVLGKVKEWDAWWTGDLDRLAAVYGGVDATRQATGGAVVKVARSVKRWFVGEPTAGQDRNTKVPMPVAAEMCQASSDLLFSDPFTVTVKAAKTQARLDEILDDDFHTTIAEAAEMAAAHGGVYLVAAWDDKVAQQAFPTVRATDQADPEFRFGRLTAVTFWSVVKTEGDNVWRHLERHEIANGVGVILHGLYQGTADTLGISVGLDHSEVTAPLAVHVDLNLPGTITTGSPGLAVTYVPNQTPNRLWRTDTVGRNLGRSDLDGTERLMDELVETMSDLMRARRAARARVLYSKPLAKSMGVGKGNAIDTAQETYVGVEALGGKDQARLTDMVQVVQPTFDPTGYLATARALLEQIVELAGYSAQTFGLDTGSSGDSAGSRTATEVESRERRSLMTRGRKLREWKPALLRFVEKLLLVDAHVFATGATDVTDLAIEFSDGVQDNPLALAQTALALYQGQSASVEERVAILHPDWQDTEVQKEAAKIREEFALGGLNDPAMAGFDANTEGAARGDEPGAAEPTDR